MGERSLRVCASCADLAVAWLRALTPHVDKTESATPAQHPPLGPLRGAKPKNPEPGPAAEPKPALPEHAATDSIVQAGVVNGGVSLRSGGRDDTDPGLSPRERDVVALLASGLPATSVAQRLKLTNSTVQQYLTRARAKYEAVSRAAPTKIDLYRRALEDGLIPPGRRSSAEVVERGLTDNNLALAALGNTAAVQEIIRGIVPHITMYCRRRLNTSHGMITSAEDVTQEACLVVLKALPGYQGDKMRFLALVHDITAWEVIGAKRSAAVRNRRTELVPQVPDVEEPDAGPEQRALQQELSGRMAELLQSLPERQREILLLRVVVGLSAEETAAAVGASPGQVRVIQHRGLAKLRTLVEEDDEVG
ncbi:MULTISPECIES: sigma-70 family RNA polymerase sigma factor [Actinosynnema]|uniref:sigma-70 family RNA polymerase sigma factor n=1 Tax=Actinosynnema TaxID=40566 RepID=UPI003557C0B3